MAAHEGGTYRHVLGIRDFKLLVVGSTASQVGDWLYNVALLVYVFEKTGSAGWVAAATMVRLLPFVLLSPIGGVLADRYERVRVQVLAGLVQAAVMAAMTVVVAMEGSALLVILLAGLNTAAATPTRPASLAMVPGVVGESNLAPANALLHTVQDVGIVAGPALGAAILAAGDPSVAFAANALTFILGSVTLAAIRTRSHGVRAAEGEAPPTARAQFVDGLRAVRHTPYVPILTFLCVVGAFTYGAQTVQLVVYAQEQLDLGADGYGYLLAATGAGGVLGATVSNRLASRTIITVPLMVGALLFVGSQLAYGSTEVVVAALLVSVLAGIGMVISDVVSEVAMTRAASNDVLGRIFGATDGITVGAMVIGAFVAAPLVDAVGVRDSFLMLGGGAVVLTLACVPVLVGLDRASGAAVARLRPITTVLEQLRIFTDAPQRALEELAKAATELRVGAGMVIIQQGDAADAFYVCTTGEVEVYSAGEDGRRETLARLAAPAYFGEIGLIAQVPRTATVRALSDCSLLRIDGATFLNALTEAPAGRSAAADGVVRGLARTSPAAPAPADATA